MTKLKNIILLSVVTAIVDVALILAMVVAVIYIVKVIWLP